MNLWKPEEDAKLRALRDEGKSYAEIGRAIGRTKNATISRAKLLKLPPRPIHHLRMESVLAARAANRRPVRGQRLPPIISQIVIVPGSKPVPLTERQGCCYPTTAGSPHLFCNEATDGGSYCPTHYRVMFRPKTQSRKSWMDGFSPLTTSGSGRGP